MKLSARWAMTMWPRFAMPEMGLMNFRAASAYAKWMNDFKDEQSKNGDYAAIIPTSGWGYNVGPAWDSAYPLIVWYLYQYCGDMRIVEEH